MKTFFIAIFVVFMSTGLIAQQPLPGKYFPTKENNQLNKIIKPYYGIYNTDEMKWVEDSNYYYLGDPINDDLWVLKDRYVVTQRDSAGNATNSLYHFYNDANGEWSNAINVSTTYYQNNQEHTHLEQPWNSDTQAWNDTSTYYNYNEEGVLVNLIYKTWDFSHNKFTNGFRRIYIMVADSFYYVLNDYALDVNTNGWYLSYHEKHYFDQNNIDTMVLQQTWSSDYGWHNIAKYYYTYDNDLLTSTRTMVWDNYLEQWVNQRLGQYSYNDAGDMDSLLMQSWDSESESWENSEKYSYYYNDSGSIDSTVTVEWNNEQALWENYSRTIISYDDNGRATLQVNQLWDDDTQQWINWSRSIKDYNEQGITTTYTYQSWNSVNENWKNNAKNDFFWSEIEVHGIDEETANVITIYPNPASETITILAPESLLSNNVKIFTISGQLVKSKLINGSTTTINIDDIPSGVYFVKFNTSHGIVTKPFVKR